VADQTAAKVALDSNPPRIHNQKLSDVGGTVTHIQSAGSYGGSERVGAAHKNLSGHTHQMGSRALGSNHRSMHAAAVAADRILEMPRLVVLGLEQQEVWCLLLRRIFDLLTTV
jgi:hypothetical protein